MKKNIFKRSFILMAMMLVLSASLVQMSNAQTLQRVIIIRHGEKPDAGENLSCAGFNRALKLANVLYAKFKTPDYIYVPSIKTGKSTAVARMYQTITPYAVKYNLSVDTKYPVDDAPDVAASVLKKTGTVLLVWEHKNIPAIVQLLGIKDPNLKWKGEDFDSIWIITFKNGKATLSVDKENINPSGTCN